MRAEIHGKLDTSRSDEDTLSDAVFSTLNYLPPDDGWLPVLRIAFPDVPWQAGSAVTARFWPALADGTEPDLLVDVAGRTVVIEAKTHSAFMDGQLTREWRQARAHVERRAEGEVLLLAVTGDSAEPLAVEEARLTIAVDVAALSYGPYDGSTAWLRWHDIAVVLQALEETGPSHVRALVGDAIALMDKRKVRHMFNGIPEADYWQVVAAQRTARERLFPALAALEYDLTHLLGKSGVEWGAPGGYGVQYWGSKQMRRPSSWSQDYLMLCYWPTNWPKRKGLHEWLFVLFNLDRPVIEVGYTQGSQSPAEARTLWKAASTELADATRSLPDYYRVSGAYGHSHARPGEQMPPGGVKASWLSAICDTGTIRWRFSRDVPAGSATPELLHEYVLESKTLVEARPSLHALLTEAGHFTGDPNAIMQTADPEIEQAPDGS